MEGSDAQNDVKLAKRPLGVLLARPASAAVSSAIFNSWAPAFARRLASIVERLSCFYYLLFPFSSALSATRKLSRAPGAQHT